MPNDPQDQIDEWLCRLNDGRIDSNFQGDIAERILELLEQRKESLGSRDKLLFADAITALSVNVNSIYQPTETGLRRCLIAIRNLLVPDETIDRSYAERHEEADEISYAMLVSTVRIIRDQIG
jgi:hypothetical protein